MATVKCPTCSRLIEWGPDFPYRPFCSERCKMVDLGAWLAEERRIPKVHPSRRIEKLAFFTHVSSRST